MSRTAEVIRAQAFESDSGEWESARWLQEIAAQLAESNELRREALELHKADSKLRETQMTAITDAQTMLATAQARMTPPPPPVPGTLLMGYDGRYGVVQENGYIKPISEEEARAKIASGSEVQRMN